VDDQSLYAHSRVSRREHGRGRVLSRA
jgi:hypothetical protein